jgi:hypothetical protein
VPRDRIGGLIAAQEQRRATPCNVESRRYNCDARKDGPWSVHSGPHDTWRDADIEAKRARGQHARGLWDFRVRPVAEATA